jgi:hypothetical protein
MMIPALLALLGTGSTLPAQQARVGVALSLGFPTGAFHSAEYPALGILPLDRYESAQREGYDLGLGGQFTISFPVESKLAIRLNFNGMVTSGSNTVLGTNADGDYRKVNLQHQIWSIGGELQLFTQSAYRHRGTFFLAGLSGDFERFDRSFGNFDSYNYYDDNVDTTRKSRLGGTLGIGRTFGFDAGTRFTLEATYHKSLTGNDATQGDPPSTDFVRVSFGWVF